MKKHLKTRLALLFGIIALIAVIGFTFISCGDGGGNTSSNNNGSQTGNQNGGNNGGNNNGGNNGGNDNGNNGGQNGGQNGGNNNGGNDNGNSGGQNGGNNGGNNNGGDNGNGDDGDNESNGDGSEENPFLLSEGTWKDGELTTEKNNVWYSFEVTEGTTYNLWCNGWTLAAGGDGTKTADIQFVASYIDGTNIFNKSYVEFSTPKQFTAIKNGTVVLKGVPWSSNGTGTYAIAYSINDTNVTLVSVTANGSSTESTTEITLTFDKPIVLNNGNVPISVVSGVTGNSITKTLSGSGNTYTIGLNGFFSGGTLSVGITPRPGYSISGSPKTVNIYYNGISWTRIDSGYFSPNAVAYGNGRFVAVSNAARAAYSTNGTTWTEVTMSNTFTFTYVGITYGYNRFVAVSINGQMSESSNGVSWSVIPNTTFGSTRINSIAYGGGRFVAVGESGKIAFATDSTVMGDWYAATSYVTTNFNDVSYGGSRFVAVGQGGFATYSNDNGSSWTGVSDMKFGTSGIYGITYGGGKFVAVGQSGKAAYSSDGITWTAVSDMKFGTTNITAITYGGGKFVAVGESGKASYSSDGITWTAVDYTAAGTGTINDITYGNGKFVSSSMAYWVTP